MDNDIIVLTGVGFYGALSTGNTTKATYALNLTDDQFHQWLVGFIDGDGSFSVYKPITRKHYYFRLKIELHKDDSEVLIYIQKRLGCGTIQYPKNRNSVLFSIVRKIDLINIIIPIFSPWAGKVSFKYYKIFRL